MDNEEILQFYNDNSDKDDNTPTKIKGVRIKMEAIADSRLRAEAATRSIEGL